MCVFNVYYLASAAPQPMVIDVQWISLYVYAGKQGMVKIKNRAIS